MRKNIKALFIDWNKTLSNSLFWSQLKDKNHLYNNYHKTIIKWLFEKNVDLFDPWMRGSITSEQICKKIARENNLDWEVVYGTLRESCENMSLNSPEIINLVEKIRQKGIKVIIATDNMDTFRKFTISGLGLDKVFDDFLISCELKVLKYETKEKEIPFFDPFLKANNWRYNEVILIDDSKDRSGVYNKLGFEIILVKKQFDLLDYLRKFIN